MSQKRRIPTQEKAILDGQIRYDDKFDTIVSMLPEVLKEKVEKVPARFWGLDASHLKLAIEEDKHHQLTTADQRLRLSLWMEFDRAVMENRMLSIKNIYDGVCSKQYFYAHVIDSAPKLAFLFTPPVEYTKAMEECLMFGVERIREILSLPLRNKKGQLDIRLMQVIVKSVQMLDLRVKGAVIQKIESRNLTANVNLDASDKHPQTMEEIEAALADLETRAHAIEQGPLLLSEKDVTIVEELPIPTMSDILKPVEEFLGRQETKVPVDISEDAEGQT